MSLINLLTLSSVHQVCLLLSIGSKADFSSVEQTSFIESCEDEFLERLTYIRFLSHPALVSRIYPKTLHSYTILKNDV
ncbi:MAG: hypothetical protein AB1861_28740 [Cyanobacteriota bacterium]